MFFSILESTLDFKQPPIQSTIQCVAPAKRHLNIYEANCPESLISSLVLIAVDIFVEFSPDYIFTSLQSDSISHLLAGNICTRQGMVWRPTELLAQQASVISSESVCGRYVTVLTNPFEVILELSTCKEEHRNGFRNACMCMCACIYYMCASKRTDLSFHPCVNGVIKINIYFP